LISVGVLLLILIASVAFYAISLKLGLRCVRVDNVLNHAVAWVAVTIFGLQTFGALGIVATIPDSSAREFLLLAFGIVVGFVVPLLTIWRVFRTTLFRSFLAYLWPISTSIALSILILLVVRPLIVEAFFVPTNAMAPTLLGRHVRATCPECGKPCYASPPDRVVEPQMPMICEKFHITEHADVSNAVHEGDRFLVAKFVKPRRWDLAVFRFPQSPETLYVKRLVGLPGETITIDDGKVHANDQPLTLPANLQGIRYQSKLPGIRRELSGAATRPAKLDQDEFFVLGDFTTNSYDSRAWEAGASGYNTYAVPVSHIVGVVSAIYWPPQRWRIFR
jgi:signal peptidase I